MSAVTTTHGADFFGQDQHPLPVVVGIAEWIHGTSGDRTALPGLLRAACTEPVAVPPADCGQYAEQLRTASRRIRQTWRRPAALLADAAARAAADGTAWNLAPEVAA